jgi:tRNA(fMet)-specific endonuclease VapC
VSLAYLFDTSILIAFLRGIANLSREKIRAAEGRIAVSTISVMELEYGLGRTVDPVRGRQGVESLLSLTEVLPFDHAAAADAGRVRADLALVGRPIGPFDALIAGHARSRGLRVITHNLKEFSRVPGLICEDWIIPESGLME